jgi:PIN like domain
VIEIQSITFFIDRPLGGKFVPNALRQAGAQVEVHHDHFPPDSPDTNWLPEVAQRGWVVLTMDANIGRNILEQVAIANSGSRVFVLVFDDATGSQMAAALIAALPKMVKLTQNNKAPFIAKVYAFGRVQMWQNHKKLLAFLQRVQF